MNYFDMAAGLARAEAQRVIPDASAGIDSYNDECALRSDMLDAAREADCKDRAAHDLDATDMQTQAALVEWFIDELLKDGHAALLTQAKAAGGFFTDALNRAAMAKAEHDWDERYA